MARMTLCECGRRLGSTSRKPHANARYVRRKGHELCDQCWQRYYDAAQAAERSRVLREETL